MMIAALLLALSLCSLSGAQTGSNIFVNWSTNGVQELSSSSPLQVNLGDNLVLQCVLDSFSNVFYMMDELQYYNCNGSIGTGAPASAGSCKNVNDFIVNIDLSLNVLGAIQFQPNQIYYFASFSNGDSESDAFGLKTSGGQCLQGLKLAVRVNPADTPPSITPTPDTGGVSPSIGETGIIIIAVVCSITVVLIVVFFLVLVCCVCYCQSKKHSVLGITEDGKDTKNLNNHSSKITIENDGNKVTKHETDNGKEKKTINVEKGTKSEKGGKNGLVKSANNSSSKSKNASSQIENRQGSSSAQIPSTKQTSDKNGLVKSANNPSSKSKGFQNASSQIENRQGSFSTQTPSTKQTSDKNGLVKSANNPSSKSKGFRNASSQIENRQGSSSTQTPSTKQTPDYKKASANDPRQTSYPPKTSSVESKDLSGNTRRPPPAIPQSETVTDKKIPEKDSCKKATQQKTGTDIAASRSPVGKPSANGSTNAQPAERRQSNRPNKPAPPPPVSNNGQRSVVTKDNPGRAHNTRVSNTHRKTHPSSSLPVPSDQSRAKTDEAAKETSSLTTKNLNKTKASTYKSHGGSDGAVSFTDGGSTRFCKDMH